MLSDPVFLAEYEGRMHYRLILIYSHGIIEVRVGDAVNGMTVNVCKEEMGTRSDT